MEEKPEKIITSQWCYPFDFKSIIQIGDTKIAIRKKFNWFQKKMIKYFFGFEVTDYE